MVEEGFKEVETYVSRHQNIVAQFIVTRPIMDLCMTAKRRLGSRVKNIWWEKYLLDVEGMGSADWEAEWKEGEEDMDWKDTETA